MGGWAPREQVNHERNQCVIEIETVLEKAGRAGAEKTRSSSVHQPLRNGPLTDSGYSSFSLTKRPAPCEIEVDCPHQNETKGTFWTEQKLRLQRKIIL